MSILLLLWLLPSLLGAVLLLLVAFRFAQRAARMLAEASAGLLIAGLPFIVVTPFTSVTKTALVILQLAALMLPARIIFGRLEKLFVHKSTQLGAFIYLTALIGVVGAYELGLAYPGILGTYQQRLTAALTVSLLIAAYFLYGYMRASRRYKLVLPNEQLSLKDLPTVTVCIPARNETHALQDCLASVILSNYPKLEILVLDDCSHDNTSRIIKAFAQDGVRFIKGDTPADGWLGKNQAMHTLAQQANGNYLLFMDVDTRLSPHSIQDMVMYAHGNKVDMLTVLPQNRLGLQPGALMTPLRNVWQMVLPITRHREPVASQCWLVRAQALADIGGFPSVARKIIPEESFAVRLAASDGYRFIASSASLGVTTAKRWNSLYESSTRVLYPTYKRQPLFALVMAASILLLGVLPFAVLIWLIIAGSNDALLWLSMSASFVLTATYALVLRHTNPHAWLLATLLMPLTLLQEAAFIVVSMLKYEFGRVDWKGRNVCYQVIGQESEQPVVAKVAVHWR